MKLKPKITIADHFAVISDPRSNEITAIPELLKVLELSGCIVTIDAIGCQKNIVKLIVQQDADYVITLKKNQGNLDDEVEKLIDEGIITGFQGLKHSTYKTEEFGHGRHEIRHYLMLSNIQEKLDPDSVFLLAIKMRSPCPSPLTFPLLPKVQKYIFARGLVFRSNYKTPAELTLNYI